MRERIVVCVQSIAASPQQVAELLGRLIAHVSRPDEMYRILAEAELSFTQLKSLHILETQGEVAVKDVAEALGLSLPTISRAIDSLVQRGLVERNESAIDRRSKLIRLLPAGRDALDRVQRARLAVMEQFVAELPENELAGLHAALLPIIERLNRQ